MAPPLIQPFPPGMALPSPVGRMPVRAFDDPLAPAVDAGLAKARDRRRRLIALVAGLPPRSKRRKAFLAELRAVTAEMLRLETR